MRDITWRDKTLQPTAIAFAFGAMTYGLLFGGGPSRLFRTTLLFVTARISYSLYLIHLPLVPLTLVLAGRVTPDRFSVFLLVFCGISYIAAVVLHYVVEKPFLILKDRARAEG